MTALVASTPTVSDTQGDSSRLLARHQRTATQALLVTLSICAPLVTLALYFREGLTLLWWTAAALSLGVWGAHALFRRGQERWAVNVVVSTVMAGSIMAIVVQGSVRSAAVLVLIAAVISAGTLLTARALVLTTVIGISSLALLNTAEQMGWLRQANLEVGLAVWITQSAVMVTVLVSVYFGRRRLTDALLSQEKALEQSLQVEAQLRLSEGRFMALFRNNPAATLVQRAATREVLDVNDAFIRTFKIPRETLIGRRPPMLWAKPIERDHFRSELEAKGRVHGFRTTGLRVDGSHFDVMVFAELLTQGDERLIVTMTLDISEQERAHRELEKSEERFSKAFDFSPLGMTIARLSDGRFMEANPANEKVLGYKPENFIGTTAATAPIWLSEEDQRRYLDALAIQGKLEAYEMRMRNQRGIATDVRLWAELIELEGEAAVLAFTMNVSEEKRREALLLDLATGVSGETGLPFFRSLVRHMAQALGADLVVAGEMHTPGTVQTLAVFFEGAPVPNIEYQVEGTPCGHAMVHAGDCFYADHLAERFPTDQFPIGGGYNTYMGVALHDADGTPIGILKALWVANKPSTSELQALMSIFSSRCNAELIRLRRDREIQRLHETLELKVTERTAQLEYLNRELDSFAYTVSHDLKSPLRSIDGFMHVLQDQMGERVHSEDQAVIGKVNGAVARMSHLINDLLALARVSQNMLGRRTVNLSDLALDVLRIEQQRDPSRLVDIEVEPGLVAHCDPHLCRIVLENLLGNAWKYTRHQKSPRIVFGQLTQSDTRAPSFFVRDNGAGFDMSRADRLFKPFNRLHSANEFEGSGIGLATVRRIIERHGGHIAGEGVVGQGSTFRFSFGNASAD
jgi:PAS domain S-box-containing protein